MRDYDSEVQLVPSVDFPMIESNLKVSFPSNSAISLSDELYELHMTPSPLFLEVTSKFFENIPTVRRVLPNRNKLTPPEVARRFGVSQKKSLTGYDAENSLRLTFR